MGGKTNSEVSIINYDTNCQYGHGLKDKPLRMEGGRGRSLQATLKRVFVPGRPQGPRPEAGELVEHWPRKEGFQEEAKASGKASGKPAWHVAGRRGVRTDAETAGGKQSDITRLAGPWEGMGFAPLEVESPGKVGSR